MLNAIKYFSNTPLKIQKKHSCAVYWHKNYAIVKLTMRSNELKLDLRINC